MGRAAVGVEMSVAMFWGIGLLSGRQDFEGLWTNCFHRAEGKEFRAEVLAIFHSGNLREKSRDLLTGSRIKD